MRMMTTEVAVCRRNEPKTVTEQKGLRDNKSNSKSSNKDYGMCFLSFRCNRWVLIITTIIAIPPSSAASNSSFQVYLSVALKRVSIKTVYVCISVFDPLNGNENALSLYQPILLNTQYVDID